MPFEFKQCCKETIDHLTNTMIFDDGLTDKVGHRCDCGLWWKLKRKRVDVDDKIPTDAV